tara:strand:+ start:503 stop:889 length:387 start_codon:yes stop_codon:yes gene_type:complete
MSAEIVGLNITRGSTFNIRITVYDDNSNVIDLTGFEVRGVIKNRYSDADADVLINLDPVVYDASAGLVDILLTSTQTSTLPITEALYDIEKFPISGQGATDKIMKGTVLIHPEITSGDDAAYGGTNPT